MVEIMQMREALATDTKLVRGMVLDHGCAAGRQVWAAESGRAQLLAKKAAY